MFRKLCFVAISIASVVATPPECSLLASPAEYDLSPLKGIEFVGKVPGNESVYFTMGVCGGVPSCPYPSLVCAHNYASGAPVTVVARDDDRPFALIDNVWIQDGVFMSFYGTGDPCIFQGRKVPRAVTVRYECEETVTKPENFSVIALEDKCEYVFTLKAAAACPTKQMPLTGQVDGESFDLSPLKRPRYQPYLANGSYDYYYVNVGAAVQVQDSACQDSEGKGTSVVCSRYNLFKSPASFLKQPFPIWQRPWGSKPAFTGVDLVFNNDQKECCYSGKCVPFSNTTIHFVCSSRMPPMLNGTSYPPYAQPLTQPCWIDIRLESVWACPIGHPLRRKVLGHP